MTVVVVVSRFVELKKSRNIYQIYYLLLAYHSRLKTMSSYSLPGLMPIGGYDEIVGGRGGMVMTLSSYYEKERGDASDPGDTDAI